MGGATITGLTRPWQWSFRRAVEWRGLRPRLDFSRLSNLVEFGAHREPQAAAGAFRNDLIDVERPWTTQRHRVEDKARGRPPRDPSAATRRTALRARPT